MTRVFSDKLHPEMKKQKSDIVLVTYANEAYIESARALGKRAKSVGFSDIRVFGPSDLTSEFIAKNRETLAFPRGAGYWVWKPAIIENALKSMDESQPLLYCDAGVMLRRNAKYFEELSQDGLIHIWSPQSHKGSNNFWIDKQVWAEIVGVSEVSKDLHYWAGLVLGKNNETFRKLLGTWLDLCQREHLLRPDSNEEYVPSTGLIGHRHDQSILNCLVHLNPSSFHLNLLNSNSRTSPVIIHRRGNIKSFSHAKFLVLVGRISRYFLYYFPNTLRLAIYTKITRKRKPHVSEIEIKAHQEIFFRKLDK